MEWSMNLPEPTSQRPGHIPIPRGKVQQMGRPFDFRFFFLRLFAMSPFFILTVEGKYPEATAPATALMICLTCANGGTIHEIRGVRCILRHERFDTWRKKITLFQF